MGRVVILTLLSPQPPHLEMPLPANPDVVFECQWAECDTMFEDLADMYEHLLGDESGHLAKVVNVSDNLYRQRM